jgi:iron complex outermembrane recepter protein
MKKTVTLLSLGLAFLLSIPAAFAQVTVSGTVKDGGSNSPLLGTTVRVKGRATGTTTDLNGFYKLSVDSPAPVVLVFSSIGYKTVEKSISGSSTVDVSLEEETLLANEVVVSASRVEESITKAAVTVEKLGARQFQQSAAISTFDALQNLKGVDLLAQSLTFKSVNLRGFGANNNNRFVQLTDGMDNRSPGLGFGFGTVAGVSDLDVESIEILPGASSALYGPDALQGLMLTKTKSPFEYQGLSAAMKVGLNNVGKSIGAKPFTDVAVRYATNLGKKTAIKFNLQAINGTDFIADDYSDRMTRGRRNFFVNNTTTRTTTLGYTPNNDPNANFEYDGVNIYGDDVTNGGSFDFAANFSNAALAGRRVTRTGYSEYDLINENGKVYSYRANVAVHHKLTDNIEASAAFYYGNGNFIRTAGFREYFPDYKRSQLRLEVKGDEFFVRWYNTNQTAEGYSLGNLAARMLTAWKPTATWATDFATAFGSNGGNLAAARAAADNGKLMPGTAAYNSLRDRLINTRVNQTIVENGRTLSGVRFLDNSSMWHAEGMYNFKKVLPKEAEVIAGASLRQYALVTAGTVFPLASSGQEFSIQEIGAYVQASYTFAFNEKTSFKPTAAVRYDKNEFFKGGLTPRISGLLSIGEHNFRGSWQSAFRNPSPNQLLSDGANTAEVGGAQVALSAANLLQGQNPGYTQASVNAYRASAAGGATPNTSLLVPYNADPNAFTTEKITTWEVGYKTLLGNKLFVDAFYYNSKYTDFIAAQNILQPIGGTQNNLLLNSATTRTYQVNFNNFNEIFVTGYGIGLEYALGKGYNASFNYAKQIGEITLRDVAGNVVKDPFGVDIVKRKMSNPEVSAVGRNFFISPEDRFNITFGNAKLTDRLGFQVTYRWTGEMWVEQGNTQGDVMLPSWSTIDAQVSYRLPAIKSMLKVGGTNLANTYYSQGYGLAQIGGLYYVGLTFNP